MAGADTRAPWSCILQQSRSRKRGCTSSHQSFTTADSRTERKQEEQQYTSVFSSSTYSGCLHGAFPACSTSFEALYTSLPLLRLPRGPAPASPAAKPCLSVEYSAFYPLPMLCGHSSWNAGVEALQQFSKTVMKHNLSAWGVLQSAASKFSETGLICSWKSPEQRLGQASDCDHIS